MSEKEFENSPTTTIQGSLILGGTGTALRAPSVHADYFYLKNAFNNTITIQSENMSGNSWNFNLSDLTYQLKTISPSFVPTVYNFSFYVPPTLPPEATQGGYAGHITILQEDAYQVFDYNDPWGQTLVLQAAGNVAASDVLFIQGYCVASATQLQVLNSNPPQTIDNLISYSFQTVQGGIMLADAVYQWTGAGYDAEGNLQNEPVQKCNWTINDGTLRPEGPSRYAYINLQPCNFTLDTPP